MITKPLALVAAGLLAMTVPAQLGAQDTASTTTTTDREDEGFDLGWLGLLGLAGLLGLKKRDDHHPTQTTNTRV